VAVGDGAEQLGGLAEAAGDERHLGGRHDQGLDQAEQGDGGGLAGLAAAVEQQARVPGLEDLDLPDFHRLVSKVTAPGSR
jgi:hypothetical protein